MELATTDITARPAWADGLLRNDPRTVRALYQQHFASVKRYVLQNSGNTSDAEDVFQEAMTVLWLTVKEGRLDPASEPGALLFRVAKYKWLDVVRSAARKHMKVVHNDQLLERPTEASTDVEERLQRLRGVYDELDDKCRQVLDRFYFERKDLAAIAEELHVTEESIRTIKYRCMMKLRGLRKLISGEQNDRP